jgi:hypothetical protein
MPSSPISLLRWTLQYERGRVVGASEKAKGWANVRIVEIRVKAIEAALSVVSGAYQTTLLTYFIHRDLFPSLMKVRIL